MKKLFFIIFCLLLVACEEQPQKIKIVQGSSLWTITEATGHSGAQWRELLAANPQLPAPEKVGGKVVVRIKPGQILTLPQGWELTGADSSKVKPVSSSQSFWHRLKSWCQAFWSFIVKLWKGFWGLVAALVAAILALLQVVLGEAPAWLGKILSIFLWAFVIGIVLLLVIAGITALWQAIRWLVTVGGVENRKASGALKSDAPEKRGESSVPAPQAEKSEGLIVSPDYRIDLPDDNGVWTTKKF